MKTAEPSDLPAASPAPPGIGFVYKKEKPQEEPSAEALYWG